MLRARLITSVQRYGGAISPLLVLVGIAVLVLLPRFKDTLDLLDENTIGHREQHIDVKVIPRRFFNSADFESDSRRVRGYRSPGTEVIAIYVNTAQNASIQLANAVTALLREQNNLGCDIQFYFVNDSTEWPIPQSYARAALVLNLSSLTHPDLCVDMYGKHGLQPNRDLVFTVLHHATRERIDTSLLCQTELPESMEKLSKLRYYFASLKEAIRLPLYPQRWHDIPTRGIATVALSNVAPLEHASARFREAAKKRRTAVARNAEEHVVAVLLAVIYSLNGLEERFHHASFVYFPTSDDTYVPFEVAQFALFAFCAAVVSTGYACYQREGFNFSPLVATALVVSTPVADQVRCICGWPGVALVSIAFSIGFSRADWNTSWATANTIIIALMESLQPATGLLCGAGVAIQLVFTHPAIASWSSVLAVGTIASWLVWAFFVAYIDLPMWSTKGISVTVISVLVYPNALWVTSRFVKSLVLRQQRRALTQSVTLGKKNE